MIGIASIVLGMIVSLAITENRGWSWSDPMPWFTWMMSGIAASVLLDLILTILEVF